MNLPLNVQLNAEAPVAQSIDQPADASLAGASRIGVLVLGMHRSGTSALARMLNLLGCSLPHTVLGANATNPAGHWESEKVLQFNDELLALAGSTWDDWLPVGEGFFTAPGYPDLVARGVELLRGEFGSASLFVFKDPRNCRLARFWLDVFAAEAIGPAVVIPIRNPLEVAQSLATRDKSDEHYGPLLWLRHVLDAESASRGKPRVFSSYDQLIDCWEVVAGRLEAGLGIAWPRMSAATQEEIGGFIDKRRHREQVNPEAVSSNPLLSGWVRRTFRIFNQWALVEENAQDHAELDAIRQAFDEATPAFARLILRGAQARHRVGQLEAQAVPLQAAAARADVLDGTLAQAQARIAEVEANAAQQLASQHDSLSEKMARVLAEQGALHRRIDELIGARDAAESSTTALTAKNAELEWLLGEARSKIEISGERLHDAEERLAEHDRRMAEQANRMAEQANRMAEQESALIQRREENEQAWAALLQEQATSADLRALLANVAQGEETQRQRLVEAEARIVHLASEQEVAQDDMRAARAAQSVTERANEALEAEAKDMALRLRAAQANSAEIETHLAKRFEEIALISRLLEQAERSAEAANARAQVAQATADDQTHIANLSQARCAELTQQVAEARRLQVSAETAGLKFAAGQADRFNEIAVLTRLLRDRERETNEGNEHIEFLRKTQLALSITPFWWALLPKAAQRKRKLGVLSRQQLFDGERYLSKYPDVAAEGMDPLVHYLKHGLSEGRDRR